MSGPVASLTVWASTWLAGWTQAAGRKPRLPSMLRLQSVVRALHQQHGWAQALTGSGLSYAILRTGKPGLDKEGSELGQLALGPPGSRPQQSALSPDQARSHLGSTERLWEAPKR